MRTAVIGGGAAGFFLAINLKEMMPGMEVTIFERSQRVLAKVEVSGGGRCNCTNTFQSVNDLKGVYPRGHRLMKRLFHVFGPRDAYHWFERHGVPLVAQADGCVFPRRQDSHAVIDCFLSLARRQGVALVTGRRVASLAELAAFDFVAVTTGGSPRTETLRWLQDAGHDIAEPVPSLFSLTIDNPQLQALQGLATEGSTVGIAGTKFRASGPLLITHWGLSGPCVLRLSSNAARHLATCAYRVPLSVNWLSMSEADTLARLAEAAARMPRKQLSTSNPIGLPQRLWTLLAGEALSLKGDRRWGDLTAKEHHRLTNTLTNYTCHTAGRAPFSDEYVTCGGIALGSVNPATLESRSVPRLFFAGEVLDIDGVTGGFNFQAAWTTAYTVAKSISEAASR